MTSDTQQTPVLHNRTIAFSSKTNFHRIFQAKVSEVASILIVASLLLLVIDPLLLHFSGKGMNYIPASERSFMIGTFMVAPINLLVIMLLVVRFFGFMHEPEASYFHFGLPILRSTYFFSLISSSFFCIFMVNLPHMLASWVLITYNEGFGDEVQLRIISDGKLFVLLFAVFTFILLISLLTGSRFDAISYTALLTLVWPIMISLVTFTITSYLPGFTLKSISVLGSNQMSAVPYSMLLVPTLHIFVYYLLEAGAVVYWLIFTLLWMVVSFVLFSGRKAEFNNAGSGFTVPYMLLRLISSFAVGLALGWAFYLANGMSGTYIFLLGTLIGSVITHIILDMIFRRQDHRWRSSIKGFLLTMVLSVIFFFVLKEGGFGYALQHNQGVPVTSIELHQDGGLSTGQPPVRVKDPEVIDMLQQTQFLYAQAVQDGSVDDSLPEPYSPAFSAAVQEALTNVEAFHAHRFFDITMVQNQVEGSSFHRKFSWEYPDYTDDYRIAQKDPALLFWLIHRTNDMQMRFNPNDESWVIDSDASVLRYDQIVKAYQKDLNDLNLEERELLGMETPLAVIVFRSASDFTPTEPEQSGEHESYWDTNGYYPVLNSGDAHTGMRTSLTDEELSLEPQENYHYEAYFEAPISERTPRTLRLISRYDN